MNTRIMLLAALSLLLLSGSANAIVLVDPDAFPGGSVINNSFPGVTLTALGSVNGPNVLSLTTSLASTGTRAFGFVDDSPVQNEVLWGDGTVEFLRVDFAMGASQVWLDFIADEIDRNAELRAFNAANVLVDSAFTPLDVPQPIGLPVTLTVSGPNIAYVLATWDTIRRIDNGAIDNLAYSPIIPEPSTLIVWSLLGALGIGVTWWRRRRAA